LIDRVKSRVSQRLSWIAQYGDYEGVVGPIEGYSMTLRAGPESETLSYSPAVRIILKKWELVSSPEVAYENLDRAQAANSRFQSELRRISRDDTITFWVYPDSFEVYRALSKSVQQLGFHLAARPLPEGKHIGGSPNGSKSVSQ